MKTTWHSLCIGLVAAIMLCSGGCTGDDGDDTGAESGAKGSSASATGEDDGDPDGGGQGCADACAALADDAQCGMVGFDEGVCTDACSSDACAACLAASEACGNDCDAMCGGGGSGDGSDDDADSGEASDDGPSVPSPECVSDDECGVSFECLSCRLTDGEGWCFQTEECSFDADCGSGGKCGYNVESGEYRCMEAEYCS